VPAFVPTPETAPPMPPAAAGWRWTLLLAAAIGAFASTQPWVRVQFVGLFGEHYGPPGWHSSAGLSCLCSCALVVVMAIVETQAPATHRATRPASLLLVAISALAFALEGWQGPGEVRGVSAIWTYAFWLLVASMPALLLASGVRCAALPAAGPPHAS
jgi:hypothetical protein